MTSASIRGVLETALYVADPDASHHFYERVFGCTEIMREEGRMRALSIPGGQVLLLFEVGKSIQPTMTEGGLIPAHDGRGILHLAFEIEDSQIEPWRLRLSDLGIPIESEVDCPNGGHSIYFRDPDGHSIEVVTRECWMGRS